MNETEHDTHAATSTKELILAESVNITVINIFYDELKALLVSGSEITIDAKHVKQIDTSALQLLCSWFQEAHKKDINVTWKNIDGIFYQSAKLLGVSEHLSLD